MRSVAPRASCISDGLDSTSSASPFLYIQSFIDFLSGSPYPSSIGSARSSRCLVAPHATWQGGKSSQTVPRACCTNVSTAYGYRPSAYITGAPRSPFRPSHADRLMVVDKRSVPPPLSQAMVKLTYDSRSPGSFKTTRPIRSSRTSCWPANISAVLHISPTVSHPQFSHTPANPSLLVLLAAWAPLLFAFYTAQMALLATWKSLRRNFPGSVFAACTFNFGPRTVCASHIDFANLAWGWCAITALGNFDPDLGGHLILWDLRLVIRFPPGSTILIPSALIRHSNVPIQAHEYRGSFVQYTAGGLFRWIRNGFQTASA